jgi:hypothetical protein
LQVLAIRKEIDRPGDWDEETNRFFLLRRAVQSDLSSFLNFIER